MLDILITAARGLAPYVAAEVRALGLDVIAEGPTSVTLRGTMDDVMRLNLTLRTGHRVLVLLKIAQVSSPDELYQAARAIPWEDYIPPDGYMSVTCTVEHPSIRDSRFVNVRTKDAIADRIREIAGRRPDSGPELGRGAVVHVYWRDEDCLIYLDTSGEPLSKRGYRKMPFKAPMIETLAAAVVMATGWSGEGAFVNPMCGSGTLAIEAALIALNRPSGLLRESFAFMHLKGFDAAAWRAMREAAKSAALKALPGRIIATDIDPAAIEAALQNARTAGVEQLIEFGVAEFDQTTIPEGGGVVVLNPEYGHHMGDAEALGPLYRRIGDFFKQRCTGYRGYVFTGNPALGKRVGLRTSRKLQMFNGPIECRLLEYALY